MNRRITATSILVITALFVGFSLASCSGGGGPGKPISIGKMPIEAHALIFIAEDRGLFAENRLNATIRDYTTGPEALRGLLSREVDIAMSGEYAVVGSVLKKDNISIIASIDRYHYFYLAGRKDRGIKNASDLKGKKIGVARGTNAEFFLGRFLNLHGINIQDVTRVDLPPSQLADAIASGSTDAVIYLRQYHDTIKNTLGSNGVFWPAQSGQSLYSLMICRKDWAASHPDMISSLLKSLAGAEAYLVNHPSDAKAVVQKKLRYSDAYMATVWQENQFALSLDRSLIAAMEDEARWMMENGVTNEKRIPDFLDYISEGGLKAVKPEAVNISR